MLSTSQALSGYKPVRGDLLLLRSAEERAQELAQGVTSRVGDLAV